MSSAPSTFGNARFVSTGVVARALGVSGRTVRRWCDEGRVDGAIKTVADEGHWRVSVHWLRERTGK